MADKQMTFRGKPIIRKGNILYYGDMSERYAVMLEVVSSKDVAGTDVSEHVIVKLLTAENYETGKAEKQTEKSGLYSALDVGSVWLERALKKDAEKLKAK